MTKQKIKRNFLENRTSWKFFEEKMKSDKNGSNCLYIQCRISLEILKELQFINDKNL